MSWSTADPRPGEPVLGDPASISALAAALRRTAGDVDEALATATATATATEDGTRSRRHAARLRALRSSGGAVTASMDRVGHLLTDHAADLADALGLSRRIVDRAESLGLRVDGTDVSRPRGVHGLADADIEEGRTEALARLQRVLDAVLLDLDTRRQALRVDLSAERERRASR